MEHILFPSGIAYLKRWQTYIKAEKDFLYELWEERIGTSKVNQKDFIELNLTYDFNECKCIEIKRHRGK